MNTDDLADLLPPVPEPRELPHRAMHRAGLLAALTGESQAPGQARWLSRLGTASRGRLLVPAAAAAAVAAIATAMAVAVPGLEGSPAAPTRHHIICSPSLVFHGPPEHIPPGFCSRHPTPVYLRVRSWQVPLAAVRAVVVQTSSGSVTVRAAIASRTANAATAGPDTSPAAVTARSNYEDRQPTISSRVTRGVLVISAQCRPDNGPPCRVSFYVRLPSAMPVRAITSLGTVQVTDMTGKVQASDEVGDVRLQDLSGPVTVTDARGDIRGSGLTSSRASLTAGRGAIDVAFMSAPTLINAIDQDGSVKIMVPVTAPYRVIAQAQLGGTTVRVPQSVTSVHVIRASSQFGDVTVTG